MGTLLEIALFTIAVVALSFWLSRIGRRTGRETAREATKGAASGEGRSAPLSTRGKATVREATGSTAPAGETPLGRRMRLPHAMRELKGRAYVIDGDTIVINRTKIRLAGIDAPELDQPYGNNAKWAMVDICRNQMVTVQPNGERSHDRIVATCRLSDGTDIGAELIRRGLALDWPLFSGGKYRHLECPVARRKILKGRRWHKSRNGAVAPAASQP